MSSNEFYNAIVQKVIPQGTHGPYAVASIEGQEGRTDRIVTFSLRPPVWNDLSSPDPGTFVRLSDLVKKRDGWRANCARFRRPYDEGF